MAMSINKEHVEALRHTFQQIGLLYPVIVDQNGRTLCGKHRELADPNCPRKIVAVKDHVHAELIVLFGNVQRQVSEEELGFRLKKLGEALLIDGYVKEPTEICAKICELLTGIYTERHIERSLPKDFKARTIPKTKQKVDMMSTSKPKKPKKTLLDDLSHTFEGTTELLKGCLCPTCPNFASCK